MFYRLFIESYFLYFFESIEHLSKIASQATGKSLEEIKQLLTQFFTLSKTAKVKNSEEYLKKAFVDFLKEKGDKISESILQLINESMLKRGMKSLKLT